LEKRKFSFSNEHHHRVTTVTISDFKSNLLKRLEENNICVSESLESKSKRYKSSLKNVNTYHSELDLKANRLALDASSASGESAANARCSPKRLSAFNAHH
jgi:hypothetical protein